LLLLNLLKIWNKFQGTPLIRNTPMNNSKENPQQTLRQRIIWVALGLFSLFIGLLLCLSNTWDLSAGIILAVAGYALVIMVFATWLIQTRLVSVLELAWLKEEEAWAAAQSKMDFLSRMSHEIRTPLGAMMGFSQLLERAKLNPEERSYLQNIKMSGEFLIRILNDILDLSKIEAAGIQLEMRPFRLSCLVDDMKRMMEAEAITKQLKFVIDCAELGNLIVVGDEHRLKQVLMNLLGNAIKFTEQGKIQLTVKATRDKNESSRAQIRFQVTDSGIGMTSAQLEKIFKPFTQAHVNVSRKFGGTGLGLSISRQLVQTMGGNLMARSTEGIGSTFYFDLDLEISDQTEALASVTEPLPNMQNPKPINHPDLRILVAEDEAINRLLISKLFEVLGYPVEFALDGQDCVDRLVGPDTYDAIFLDLHMPYHNGMEIAERIKKGDYGSAVQKSRLTIMSADVLADARGKEIGVDGFISKPINIDELKKSLNSITSQKAKPNALRALIVEDQALNRQMIGQIIYSLGMRPDFAHDGIECIEFLEKHPELDLIFLDLRMPRMDGWTVARKIRNGEAGENFSQIPIAIVSAEIQAEEVCRAIGVDEFITKPFDISQIRDFVNKVGVGLSR
jgi:two-component system, sensor histidine kinase and response regulator